MTHIHEAHGVVGNDIIIYHVMESGRVRAASADVLVRQDLAVVVFKAVGFENGGKSALSDARSRVPHHLHMSLGGNIIG